MTPERIAETKARLTAETLAVADLRCEFEVIAPLLSAKELMGRYAELTQREARVTAAKAALAWLGDVEEQG